MYRQITANEVQEGDLIVFRFLNSEAYDINLVTEILGTNPINRNRLIRLISVTALFLYKEGKFTTYEENNICMIDIDNQENRYAFFRKE